MTTESMAIPRPLSIAPMLDWSDRHFRYFFRLISRRVLLYTEMVTTSALLHGDREKLLDYSCEEKPLALQLGGDDPKKLAECVRIARDYDYDEVNLNVGCPSDRVQSGRFGACLMAKPQRVADAVHEMKKVSSIPVTVKHRIGIDGLEGYDDLADFVRIVLEGGCDRFIVHARIARLSGLSPKENRSIPPLRYAQVYRLKNDFPQSLIDINGGVTTLQQVLSHLEHVDGVMVGRAAYGHPYAFSLADQVIFADCAPQKSRGRIIEAMAEYLDRQLTESSTSVHKIINPMLNLFKGKPAARSWRRFLSENIHKSSDPVGLLLDSVKIIPAQVLQEVSTFSTP
ncbi:tRNA dihydrouridine(20/20a) synthase DusA [candidate division KSB1 bacterium]|nr:tRNA dihydrouridine(20/20a) synthase DusA [candidate division KSB1 bacterium]